MNYMNESQHNNQSMSNSYPTIGSLNNLNRSTTMKGNRHESNDRVAGSKANATHGDNVIVGGAVNARAKYNDMEEEDIDSLSDISTEKSDLNSSRGEYNSNRFNKNKSGTNTTPNPATSNNMNNSFSNNIVQKKRSRGQPIISNGATGPNGSSSQVIQMTMSSSVQNNETASINMESTDTTQMDDNDDLKMKTKNREHAKKTRIRKKNYIESLKETVKLFSEEREKADRDTRMALTRLAEQVRIFHEINM